MTPVLSSTLLRTQSDARLMALAGRGGERAFEAIVERYRKPLLRWCRRFLPEARAEDAVQTTFLKAWVALQEGAAVDELRPWLYRIARNTAIDNARKAGYDYDELKEALRVAPGPDDELERRQVIRQTLAGVAGLPDKQREALLQTAAGHSRADIARGLDLSEGAVRQLVHRARTTLRAAATAITPAPLASWAAAMGATGDGAVTQRIAELSAGAGSVGVAATAVKAGTVIVAAGVIAVGPGADLRHHVARDSKAAASSDTPSDARGQDDGPAGATTTGSADVRGGGGRGESRGRDGGSRGRSGSSGKGSRDSSRHGSGSGGSGEGGNDHSGSSGSGSGDRHRSGSDDRSGSSGSGGDGKSGSSNSGSGSDDSGSGSGNSGSSGSGSGDSGSDDSLQSGSGDSGSGSSGSDSGGDGHSGSGSGDSGTRTESTDD